MQSDLCPATIEGQAMGTELLSKVSSDDRDFMVITKTTYLVLLFLPRSSVTPYRIGSFAAAPGFQVHYNTTDSRILAEWHEMLCGLITTGLFDFLCESVRTGYFPYPEGKEHLQQHVKRFL
jgi:hypothetical protein